MRLTLSLSLELVLSFEVSRIARVRSIPLLLVLSISMYFWQRLCSHETQVGVPKEELIMPFCLK
jgi:hypothetical protein